MSFLKKQGAGFYFAALTLIASVVGLVCYFINCNTAYFSNLGTSSLVIGCAVIGIVALALYLVLAQKGDSLVSDVMPVIAGVTLMLAAGNFAASRVSGIASIMTFEYSAQNMSDLTSAIAGIAALVIAALLNIIGSFLRVSKD